MDSTLNVDISGMSLIIISIVLFIVILVASFALLRLFKTVLKLAVPDLEKEEKAAKVKTAPKANEQTFWQKVLGLRPIEEEEDLLIDHTYDGIQELDNPTPVWFNALFYSTIVFAIGYLLIYHVFGWGMNQEQEYLAEMQAAEVQRMEYLATSGTNIDENNVELDLSPEMVIPG